MLLPCLPRLQLFAWQCEHLDALARRLALPSARDRDRKPPFADDTWRWQVPEAELLADNRQQAAPPLPLEAPLNAASKTGGADAAAGGEAGAAQAAGVAEAAAAAPADPRLAPPAAAELAAARTWYQLEVEPPAFAYPVAPAPVDSGVSWSHEPQPEGQQEVTSAAAAAAGGEERPAGEGGEPSCHDRHWAPQPALSSIPPIHIDISCQPLFTLASLALLFARHLLQWRPCTPPPHRATTTPLTAPWAWPASPLATAPPRLRRATGRQWCQMAQGSQR
jgi:hypothetical protein